MAFAQKSIGVAVSRQAWHQRSCCRNPRCDGGRVFCYLPVGELQTRLPVHVNASFCVKKNRRSLWMDLECDGDHARWSRWNHALLNSAIPRLWKCELRRRCAELSVTPAHILGLLPDLERVTELWQPCATRLYELLRDEPVLPHSRRLGNVAFAALPGGGMAHVRCVIAPEDGR